MPGKGEAGGHLVQPVGGGRQDVGNFLGGQAGHLLDAAHQHNVVHSRGNGHDALAQGAAAAGAGVFDASNGNGGHAQPIGHDGRGVALTLEQVGGVVAQVAALDVFNVDALVHAVQQVLEGRGEKVTAGEVLECAEGGHTGSDYRDLSSQLTLLGDCGHMIFSDGLRLDQGF